MGVINYDLDENVKLPQIAREILAMGEADQKAIERNDSSIKKLTVVHTGRVREIISEFGYPVISLVGKKASHWAWLVIQHSDHDVGFQESCLELMESAPGGEVAKANIAYLVDRVRENRGLPQIYGTQVIQDKKTNKFKPNKLKYSVEKTNELRRKIGLESIEKYLEKFNID